MKTLNLAVITILILALLAVCLPAQELPVLDADRGDARIEQPEKSPAKEGEAWQPETVNAVPFTALSGIGLDDMSSGTTQLIAGGTDNANSALTPIGFLFRFGNVNYTDFGASGNGVVRLGSAITFDASANSIASGSIPVKIAPYWDDLCVGNGGKVHYKVTGAAGSRKLVVEWRDMKITRGTGCNGVGGGNFQLWLSEGSGTIQFVYGSGMIAASANDGGYTVGIAAGSSDFASVTTFGNSVSYTSANDVQISAISEGISYLFSPIIPTTPTNGTVTNLTQTSLQLNWTHSDNRSGYIVRRSTDNVNFTLVAELGFNTSTYADSGLTPGTQYFYKVNAFSDGALSGDLNFSPTTNPSRNISSAGSGGLWNSPATWAGGIVPTAGDNVTIVGGSTVVLNDNLNAAVYNLTVGSTPSAAKVEAGESATAAIATLTFPSGAAVAGISIARDVLINPEGVFTTSPTGFVTPNGISVGGNLTNNGVLDFSTNNGQTNAGITFFDASNNTFSGNGPTTDIYKIRVDKGTTRDNILEITVANFSVRGSTTDGTGSDYLSIKNGTCKISGTFTGSYKTLLLADGFGVNYIGAKAGFWLNNPNYTVVGQSGSPNMTGLLRVSAGTFNVGTQSGDSLVLVQDSLTIIEGGNVNTTGRFSVENSASRINYYQTGGTVTACTIGHISTTFACFDMGRWLSTGANVVMSGGDIVIQNPTQIASGPRDYRHSTSSDTPSAEPGTTLHFGNGLTAAGSTFHGVGSMPNLDIGNGHTLALVEPNGVGNQARNITIGGGATLDIGDYTFTVKGSTFTNNGTLIANSPGASIFFGLLQTEDITYTGMGNSTGIINSLNIYCNSLTFGGSVGNLRARNIQMFSGDIINAGKITLGNNDALVNTMTFGWGGPGAPGGTFDSAPVFDLGTGGQSISYLKTNSPQTTGPEINPARTLVNLVYDDTNVLTVTGGDLTITGQLSLARGEVNTGESTITINSIYSRNTGYVNGAFRWRILSTGFITFPIGQDGIYLPVDASINSIGVVPSFLSVRTIDGTLPGLLPATSASRYWRVVETGDITASLLFRYSDADVNGIEANYVTWRSNGGSPVLVPGSNANPANNSVGTAFGINALSGDWGVGEGADPGPVSISGRVATSTGNPIANARVVLTGGNLPGPVIVNTGSLGFYVFNGVQAGENYNITVSAKRYRFPVGGQNVTPFGNVTDVDFMANPQE